MCRGRKRPQIHHNPLTMLFEAKSFNAKRETLCFWLIMIIMLIVRLSILGWNGEMFLSAFSTASKCFHIVFECSSICLCAVYNYVSECLRVFVSAHVSVYPCLPSVLHLCVCLWKCGVHCRSLVPIISFFFSSHSPLFFLLWNPISSRMTKKKDK